MQKPYSKTKQLIVQQCSCKLYSTRDCKCHCQCQWLAYVTSVIRWFVNWCLGKEKEGKEAYVNSRCSPMDKENHEMSIRVAGLQIEFWNRNHQNTKWGRLIDNFLLVFHQSFLIIARKVQNQFKSGEGKFHADAWFEGKMRVESRRIPWNVI
jgi:hypothetical protein